MKKHTLKDWFLATRPWSFPVSVIPIVATYAYMGTLHDGFANISFVNFLLALLGMVIFHCAGNLISDWNDHRTGVDNERAYAVPNLVFGHFAPKEYLVYGLVMLLIGSVIGVLLMFRCGEPLQLLAIGGAGLLLTVLYSFFKGRALGEMVIFAEFAVLPMLGTSLVVCGAVDYRSLVLSLPIGLVTVGVLYINNIRDRKTDAEAGIRTFVMGLRDRSALVSYLVLISIPMLLVPIAVAVGLLPWPTLIALVGILPVLKIVGKVKSYPTVGNEAIAMLDQQTAQLQMVFGVTLILGLFVGALL